MAPDTTIRVAADFPISTAFGVANLRRFDAGAPAVSAKTRIAEWSKKAERIRGKKTIPVTAAQYPPT